MGIFKAYDIRGIYGEEFTADEAYRIGYFLPRLLDAHTFLVGHDARLSSEEIFDALARGICDSGANVCYVGLATTPMIYFATAWYGFDASVQITASHNPPQYNGFKISRKNAIPVGFDTGLGQLEQLVATTSVVPAVHKGMITRKEIRADYVTFLKRLVREKPELPIGIDCSNGVTGLVVRDLFGSTAIIVNEQPDGRFPAHDPNPLVEANLEQLRSLVKRERLDLGIMFDGDGDRVVFVDERGRFVRPDLMIAMLGEYYLRREHGIVLHDVRTSRAVIRYIQRLGGIPYMWKVGHAHAKLKLREMGGIFGGELAGHYYFRDFFYCDSGMLASLVILTVLNRMKRENRPLSTFVDELNCYANSGELNFRIADKAGAMERLRDHFTSRSVPLAVYDFDGYRIEFPDWWFSVRPSNTEPFLRLIAEADEEKGLKAKLDEIYCLLKPFVQ
ncbi:MAG: phosphomannomutase/phosphoglucomutase [Kiritimatiellae bacterium]|nr:phosphomannomutase/phosphoglucomutase [Kiritimatiellia bacterium]